MSNDTIEEMLKNYDKDDFDRDTTRVQSPDNISILNNQSSCPDVLIANISQDHWYSCKEGPSLNKDDRYRTWTAISERPPSSLTSGSILIVRRTIRESDGTIRQSGKSGVMGIWVFSHKQPVQSNSNHPFNKSYSWYLHCITIETCHNVAYNESWEKIKLTPQSMTGHGIFALNKYKQIRFLREIVDNSTFNETTKEYLQTLIECKS